MEFKDTQKKALAKSPSSAGRTSANPRSSIGWPGETSRSCTISPASRGIGWPRLARAAARPFTVWDTGGIGGAGETELTAQVRTAADAAMRESDVILFVVDAQDGLTPIDQELARILRKSQAPVVLVVNKIDHDKHEDLETDFASSVSTAPIPISAAHGRGISGLLETIDHAPARRNPSPIENREPKIANAPRPGHRRPAERRKIVADQFHPAGCAHHRQRTAGNHARRRRHPLRARRREISPDRHRRDAGAEQTFHSVEVFSVMRAERTIRRADLCVLVIDLTSGVTSQDKKIAGLIQEVARSRA